jgi:chaperonin cofactor prefoldin
MAAGIHEEGWNRIDEDGELWRQTGKVGWQKTLEDLEKLLEEAKEPCEKRSRGLLLSRIILGVKRR